MSQHVRPLVAGWACAAVLLASVAGADGATRTAWVERYRSNDPMSNPVLAGGRVWWVSGSAAAAGRQVLYSRTLRGGDLRRVRLWGAPSLSAGGRPTISSELRHPEMSMIGSRIAVRRQHANSTSPGASYLEPTFVDVYDRGSGALVRTIRAPTHVRLVEGTDVAVIDSQRSPGTPTMESLSRSPEPLPADKPDDGTTRLLLHVGGSGSSHGVDGNGAYLAPKVGYYGWEWAEVRERRSGRLRYRVTSRALGRVGAGGRDDGRADLLKLLPDGSLAVAVSRRVSRGVRPIYVDPRGRIRRLGAVVPGALVASGLFAHGRGLVYLSGDRCERTWVVDQAGRRGRPLPPTGRLIPPSAWTGDVAVWGATVDWERHELGELPGTRAFAVDLGLRHLRLSTRQRPRC